MSDSFLSNAGSLFFLAWSAIVAGVSIAAFGRDLLPVESSESVQTPTQSTPQDDSPSARPS